MRLLDSLGSMKGFLVLFVLAIITQSVVIAVMDCENLSDCNLSSGSICAMDKENVCFTRFPTECHMKSAACENQKEYIVYVEEYCNLVGFMCSNEYKEYNEKYARDENVDNVVYSIYKGNNPGDK